MSSYFLVFIALFPIDYVSKKLSAWLTNKNSSWQTVISTIVSYKAHTKSTFIITNLMQFQKQNKHIRFHIFNQIQTSNFTPTENITSSNKHNVVNIWVCSERWVLNTHVHCASDKGWQRRRTPRLPAAIMQWDDLYWDRWYLRMKILDQPFGLLI